MNHYIVTYIILYINHTSINKEINTNEKKKKKEDNGSPALQA